MRGYETTFILASDTPDEEIEKIVENYKTFIEGYDAKILKVETWGKRRLAYEIANNSHGYYGHIRFDVPTGTIVNDLERRYKLDDLVIRYLTVRLDRRALKAERVAAEKSAAESAQLNN